MWKGKWKEPEKEVVKEPERGKFVFKKPGESVKIVIKEEEKKEEKKDEKKEEKKEEKIIFNNINTLHVEDNPVKSMIFVLEKETHINSIKTYHCGGVNPVGTLELVDLTGKSFGLWEAVIVNKLFWECYPNIDLPAGSYQVVDSNPATWSWNGLSLVGFTEIK